MGQQAHLWPKKKGLALLQVPLSSGIAGGGFEPPTSGLWARFAPKTANPAVPGIYI
jgi:hypothetical protein